MSSKEEYRMLQAMRQQLDEIEKLALAKIEFDWKKRRTAGHETYEKYVPPLVRIDGTWVEEEAIGYHRDLYVNGYVPIVWVHTDLGSIGPDRFALMPPLFHLSVRTEDLHGSKLALCPSETYRSSGAMIAPRQSFPLVAYAELSNYRFDDWVTFVMASFMKGSEVARVIPAARPKGVSDFLASNFTRILRTAGFLVDRSESLEDKDLRPGGLVVTCSEFVTSWFPPFEDAEGDGSASWELNDRFRGVVHPATRARNGTMFARFFQIPVRVVAYYDKESRELVPGWSVTHTPSGTDWHREAVKSLGGKVIDPELVTGADAKVDIISMPGELGYWMAVGAFDKTPIKMSNGLTLEMLVMADRGD